MKRRRNWFLGLAAGAAMAAGCAHLESPATTPEPGSATVLKKPLVTPDFRPLGQVETVNVEGKFAVLSFAGSAMPAMGQEMGVYHDGQKVGEVKITGPVRESNIVADIVAGEAQAQDEIKPD